MRVVLLVLLLAGCVSEGSGARSDDLYINLGGQGDWTIDLPMPEDGLFGLPTWRDSLRVSSGHAKITWADGALPVHVEGNGSVRLEALARVDGARCCLLDYREALWTSGPAADGLPVEIGQGAMTVNIDHNVVVCRSGCDPGEVPKVCTQRLTLQAVEVEGRHVDVPHIGRTC